MRITFGHSFDQGVQSINRASADLARAQRIVATGRKLHVASDDPSGMAASIDERAALATVEQYERSSDAARSRLAVADAVLSDMVGQLTAAKVAAVAARTSSRTPQQLRVHADEMRGIRDTLLGDINAKFGSTYLFSGASTNPPYAKSGVGFTSYQGGGEGLEIDIADGRSAQVTFKGDAMMQGTSPDHILDALTDLATAIESGDTTGIDEGMTAIDAAFDRVVFTQTQVGIGQRTLAEVGGQLTAERLSGRARLSGIEDANMAEAISNLNQAEIAHQATLGSFATLGRLTLMDYLK